MSRARRAAADERGFTLIEMLVTMSLALVVLFAILGASEIFSRSAGIADKTAGAQDSARATVRSMVHVLRQGRTPLPSGQTTPIAGAPTRSDLVVAAYVTAGGSEVAGWVRYCATGGAQPSLVKGIRVGDAYLPAGACSVSDTTNGWQHTVMLDRTLQDASRLFDFTTSTCTGADCTAPVVTDIQSVGIRVAVGTSPQASATHNSVVRDAVSFRNRSTT